MFGRIGRFAATHARGMLAITVLLMLGAGALGVTAFGKLKTEGGFIDPDAESSQAQELVNRHFGGDNDVVFLFSPAGGTVDDPANRRAGAGLTERMATDPGLTERRLVLHEQAPPLRAEDGRHAIVVAKLTDEGDVETAAGGLRQRFRPAPGPGRRPGRGQRRHRRPGRQGPRAGGVDRRADHHGAAGVAFGSVVAALLPLAIGALAVLGTFALLSILGSVTDVSVFAINLTTALGLGLAIDYALLMVSRFREELDGAATTKSTRRRRPHGRRRPADHRVQCADGRGRARRVDGVPAVLPAFVRLRRHRCGGHRDGQRARGAAGAARGAGQAGQLAAVAVGASGHPARPRRSGGGSLGGVAAAGRWPARRWWSCWRQPRSRCSACSSAPRTTGC